MHLMLSVVKILILQGIMLSPLSNDDSIIKKKKCKDENEFHVALLHTSEATTQAIGKIMNFIKTREFQP